MTSALELYPQQPSSGWVTGMFSNIQFTKSFDTTAADGLLNSHPPPFLLTNADFIPLLSGRPFCRKGGHRPQEGESFLETSYGDSVPCAMA